MSKTASQEAVLPDRDGVLNSLVYHQEASTIFVPTSAAENPPTGLQWPVRAHHGCSTEIFPGVQTPVPES